MVRSQEEIDNAKASSEEKLHNLYKRISDLSYDTVNLYDRIEEFFFQDVDFQMFQGVLPSWMANAGCSPESEMSKANYDRWRQIYNDPISNRVIHWFDVQNIIGAFQDRISSTERHLKDIFAIIPAFCLYDDNEYTGATRGMDPSVDMIHTSINSVFVSLASAFDLFTKIVYECSKYNPNGFGSYKKLKSRIDSILYAKKNYCYNELKEPGLLYDEPACIRTICSLRDEFIHCGSWDYRCAIYYPQIDGVPVEPFIPMPDIESPGVLVSSGSRNKFYASGLKINTELPRLVAEVIEVLSKTEARLKEVLMSRTSLPPQKEREEKAMCYMKVLSGNMLKLTVLLSQ